MWQRLMVAGSSRPRLLIEHSARAYRLADFGAFHEAGFDVTLCSGPEDDFDTCPLVGSEGCAHAAGADVVYFGLDLGRPEQHAVLKAIREHYPDTPVVVEVSKDAVAGSLPVLEGCGLLKFPASLSAQVRALRACLVK